MMNIVRVISMLANALDLVRIGEYNHIMASINKLQIPLGAVKLFLSIVYDPPVPVDFHISLYFLILAHQGQTQECAISYVVCIQNVAC